MLLDVAFFFAHSCEVVSDIACIMVLYHFSTLFDLFQTAIKPT